MTPFIAQNIGRYMERSKGRAAMGVDFGLLGRSNSDPKFVEQLQRLDRAMQGLPVNVGKNLVKRLARKVMKPVAAKYRSLWLAERPKRPTNVVRRDIAKAIIHSADVRLGMVVATTGVKVNRSRRARLASPINARHWHTREKMVSLFTRADFEREFSQAIEEQFAIECRKSGLRVKG